MSVESIAYSIGRFFKKNGGTILTCIAAGGVVGTGILSGWAAVKAHEKLKETEHADTKDKIKAVAPIYAIPASVGAATIACMFGANHLDRKQQASLLAASALIEQTYKRYKGKAEELLGEGKVETEIAKENYSKFPKTDIGEDEQLFYYNYYHDDPTSEYGFYFTASKEKVLRAEYELNRTFNIRATVSLNDFMKLLGQKDVEGGNEVGWSYELGHDYYGYSWIDFEHYDTTMDDGLECTIITTPFDPCLLDESN